MIARIIEFSVRARWAVLFVTLVAAGIGVWQALLLPIDVTPDITNKQVQINTVIPNLTPVEVETNASTQIKIKRAVAIVFKSLEISISSQCGLTSSIGAKTSPLHPDRLFGNGFCRRQASTFIIGATTTWLTQRGPDLWISQMLSKDQFSAVLTQKH